MKTADLIKKYSRLFNTDYTQDANCQGAWLMNYDEDPIRDSSQNNNTGALEAAGHPDFASVDPPSGGFSIGYYEFSDDIIDCGSDGSLDNMTVISFVGWYWIDIYDNALGAGRLYEKRAAAGQRKIAFFPGGVGVQNKRFGFGVARTGVNFEATSQTDTYDTGEWFHHGVSWDGGLDASEDIIFYHNGVEMTHFGDIDGTGGIAPDNDGNFYLGNRPAKDRDFNKRMTQVGIFDRVIDATEMNDIMDNGMRGIVSNPWPISMLRKNVITGYHCFMQAYMKATIEGFDPLKLPDGTIF